MKKVSSIVLSSFLATGAVLPVALQTNGVSVQAAEAQGVELPLMLSNVVNYENAVGYKILNSGDGRQFLDTSGYDIDIKDIITGQKLRTVFTGMLYVIANKNEDVFISTDEETLYSATKYEEQERLPLDGIRYSYLSLVGFIGNTNKFVVKKNDSFFVYDYDQRTVLFEMPLPNNVSSMIVGKDILVATDKAIMVYDENGEYKDILQLESNIKDLTFSPDGQTLVVATEAQLLQFYDTTTYHKKTVVGYENTDNVLDLTFDPTGKYLAMTSLGDAKTKKKGFRLFNMETGQRIYTSLDNEFINNKRNIVLANDAQFIFYGKNTYNGKNLNVYATGIATKTYTMNVDEEIKPEAFVQYSNGTMKTVTSGVTWKSSDLTKGFYDEKKQTFKAREAGLFNVQVSYLGFTKEITINVLDEQANSSEDSGLEEMVNELEVPTYMDGNYYNEGLGLTKVYLDQRVYNAAKYRYATHVAAFTGKTNNGKVRTYLDIARKSSTMLDMKKIVIKANGKSLTKKVTSTRSSGYEHVNKLLLSESNLKWLKKNIKSNKKVTIQFVGKKKTVTKTLNVNQKKALLDNVSLNENWKAFLQ